MEGEITQTQVKYLLYYHTSFPSFSFLFLILALFLFFVSRLFFSSFLSPLFSLPSSTLPSLLYSKLESLHSDSSFVQPYSIIPYSSLTFFDASLPPSTSSSSSSSSFLFFSPFPAPSSSFSHLPLPLCVCLIFILLILSSVQCSAVHCLVIRKKSKPI